MKISTLNISILALGAMIMSANCTKAKEETAFPVNPENPVVTIETSMGIIKAELFQDKAPLTVSNFISLVEKGFYDGVIFHRIIKDFMIQTGDPQGTGMGGPGYSIKDEFHPELNHKSAGILSMANAGPNTGGSQFFITLIPTNWLDEKHAIFGQIISGMDIVHKIGVVKTGMNDRPIEIVHMIKLTLDKI